MSFTKMIALPPALSSWSSELDLFPTEIATSLAPLVLRLDRIIGALRASQWHGSGEPDGVDGLARRGSYERLLLSEWLLADEIPLEFTRRAANDEHTFLQLARREPQGAPLCVALFDAGPNQIGAPRLAHLAALIVLFRRAQNGGAHFCWGTLQEPETQHKTLTASNIRHLILARSSREATTKDWEAWREIVQSFNSKETPDVWVVGGQRLQREHLQREHRVLEDLAAKDSAAHVSLLQIRDDWEVSGRQIWAQVVSRDRQIAPREIALDLPDDQLCARLLRDPFAVATTEGKRTHSRYASSGNFLWGNEGKLMSRGEDGKTLVIYPVPNSPRATVGKSKLYRPDDGDQLVAAGIAAKAVLAVTLLSPTEIAVQAWGKGRDRVPQGRFTLPFALPESRDQTLLPCGVLPMSSNPTLLVLLPGRRLVKLVTRWEHTNGRVQSHHEASYESQNALALRVRGDDVVFVTANLGIFRVSADERKQLYKSEHTAQGAFFGFHTVVYHPPTPLTAFQISDEHWMVPQETTPRHWNLSSSTRVQGVFAMQGRWPTSALVTIEDQTRVVLRGDNWTYELPSPGAPIEHVNVSPFAPDFAMRTIHGEIAVYSLNHSAWTLRLEPDN